jgi:drug/metabolite transporter (DMT)-like permease
MDIPITVRIVFVLIISVIVLSEPLTIQKMMGVLLIFLGMGYLNKKQNLLESFKFIFKDRVAVLVLISALIFSFANVNDKNSLNYFDSFTYPFLIYGGISLFTSTYLISNRKKLREFGNLIKDKWALTLAGSFCVSGAYIFFLFMALQTDVSIIVPLLNISIFISLFLGKYVLKEKIESRWVAAALMVIGAALLMMPQYL